MTDIYFLELPETTSRLRGMRTSIILIGAGIILIIGIICVMGYSYISKGKKHKRK